MKKQNKNKRTTFNAINEISKNLCPEINDNVAFVYLVKIKFGEYEWIMIHDETWHEWIMPQIRKNKFFKIISIKQEIKIKK